MNADLAAVRCTESPLQRLQLSASTENPVTMICDVETAFEGSSAEPNALVVAAFGSGPLHACRLGEWDFTRALGENADALVRSIHDHPKAADPNWLDLSFQFGPRSILCSDLGWIVGFASTHAEAERLVTEFNDAYTKPPEPTGGSFHLIVQDAEHICCRSVPLAIETMLDDATLALHYSAATVKWHHLFVRTLRAQPHGLSILEGTPGTGETSYLRHLMGTLKDSHRFYFIPTSTLDLLSEPEFIGFWANQRQLHADRRFVVVLEDSDAALMTRDSDNREQVSAILNLSDGMLADFLRLQIICTINCAAAEIDQALLRPGRLLSSHVFDHLSHARPSDLPNISASNCRWERSFPSRRSLPAMLDESRSAVRRICGMIRNR
jgi:hypothetical protein